MKPRLPPSGASSFGFSNILLCLNAILMIVLISQLTNNSSGNSSINDGALLVKSTAETTAVVPPVAPPVEPRALEKSTPSTERNFLQIALKTGTDKVLAHANLKSCLEKGSPCLAKKFQRDACRPWGHFYDTLYQRWLAPFSTDNAAPFQFLEIGFYAGHGFAAFEEFLPKAEAHSIEIACMNDGKDWNLGNTAKSQRPKLYERLISNKRLHCGSAIDLAFLNQIWTQHMQRADAPPLKVVIDDASHQAQHMVQSVFFWFPKIEPGGFMVVEDVQPIPIANGFRSQFLPQIMSDLHWCGHPDHPEQAFFDTLWPLLASISCEMHICIFERNQEPANLNLSFEQLTPPAWALDYELALKTRKSIKALK